MFRASDSSSLLKGCKNKQDIRGGSRISGKGVRMQKGVGVYFADFI